MHTRSRIALVVAATAGPLALPGTVHAQKGAGATGATVLQLLAGGRAAALSGAYTAATGDADALFYNPAGIGTLSAAAAVSYQRHVEDIGVATGSGAYRVGPVVVGASAIFLDYGEIDELTPDPDFGGQTGALTGATVSASELAARVGVAWPVMQNLRVGGAVGLVSSDLAETSRSTALFDLGVQYDISHLTLGGSLRNLGGSLSGGSLADAELPSEARLGAAYRFTGANRLGGGVYADFISELNESRTGLVAGIEGGLMPAGASRLGAVARVGYNGAAGSDGLGALQLGGGILFGSFSVDYAYQNYDAFGALHRIGIRWQRLP